MQRHLVEFCGGALTPRNAHDDSDTFATKSYGPAATSVTTS